MRIATWNCCGKFDTNLPNLLDLGIDVAVVCEARTPLIWSAAPDGREVTGVGQRVWGDSPRELAIVACGPWTVTPHEAAESAPDWLLPVRVSGPTLFTLVGLWSVEFAGTPSYVEQLDQAVDWIEKTPVDGPIILAGDFNAPITTSQRRYDEVVRRLTQMGLVDAYRVTRGLQEGESPTEGTYYHWRRQGMPFHIDHVLVPTEWADGAKVEIGDFETWIASGRSDHVPVVVDLDVDRLS